MNSLTLQKIAGKSVLLLTILVIGTLAVSSCRKKTTDSNSPTSGSTPIKIKVGYIPIAECAHLYVGISKRFFEREGLEIELVPMSGGAVILPAVQGGSLDIGFTNVASLVILNSKLPPRDPDSFVIVAGGSYERPGSSNHALLTKNGREVSIASLADGSAKIAINTTRNIEELMLRRFLEAKGFRTDKTVIVPLPFPDMLSALERGDVDVIAEVEPFIEPALRSGKASLLARHYLDVSPDTVVATYGVTRKWRERHPEVAAAFRRAFDMTGEFIRNNDAETRQIIGSFTRITTSDLPIIGMAAFESQVSRSSLQELVAEMRRNGFIVESPASEDMLDGETK